MMAAGSPGDRCNSRKMKTPTSPITSTVEIRRRMMKASMSLAYALLAAAGRRRPAVPDRLRLVTGAASGLLGVPERHHAGDRQHAHQVLAPRRRLHPLSEPHVRHEVPSILLQLAGDCLLVRDAARGRPFVAQFLVLGVRRPAEPGLVAGRRMASEPDRIAAGGALGPSDAKA